MRACASRFAVQASLHEIRRGAQEVDIRLILQDINALGAESASAGFGGTGFSPARESGRDQIRMARPEGVEPPTLCLEGRRSIQLSYGRAACN